MNRLKNIRKLSETIAKKLINNEELTTDHLGGNFSEIDTKDIISDLTDEDKVKSRRKQVAAIQETKNEDWKRISKNYSYKTSSNTSIYKIAAILVISISLGYVSFNFLNNSQEIVPESNKVGYPIDEITLDLGNGKTTVLSSTNSDDKTFENNILFSSSKDNFQLDYTSAQNQNIPNSLVYNELNVPYGRSFKVILSDGTKVHLNSGSKLKYPLQFIQGKERTVFLEGEGYFEVTKNKSQPFIVNANNMFVEVLGTTFNVMAYPEDSFITTILVEGSVAIGNNVSLNDTKTLLKPNQQASWVKEDGKVNIKSVKPTIYTAWTEGRTVFEHMKFKNILKKLERKYNVKITNHNEKLANEKFTATFDYENINQVLTSFSKNYNFSFSIENNNIIIN